MSLRLGLLFTLILSSIASAAPPNVIIILTDDQGYNDVGCYGSRQINTPRLDRMAAEGMRFTDWYAPASVCTPTRAGLLTGCYPQRLGLSWILNEKPNGAPGHVLYGNSRHGLNLDELTIAELLKARGYATGLIGKWHLGDATQFLPTRQGFDTYFGIPYSHDMKPPVLLRGETKIEEPVIQETLLERYTNEATQFIRDHRDKPFFLYFAHNAPHTPLIIADRFKGKSARGLYGDMIEAIDGSVGQVLDTLAELKLDENTLVVFTSDNGPWLIRGEHGGSAFPLRSGKGTTYEGGMRVPCIVRWPGHVPAGRTSHEPLSHLDLMPTVANLAGATVPNDRVIDGKDITPILLGQPGAKNPHEAFFYYADGNLNAVRSGKWKLKLPTTLQEETEYGKYETPDAKIPQALYDLENDVAEQKNLAADHPDIVARLAELADQARQDLGDRRTSVTGKKIRPVGRVDDLRVMTFNIRVSSIDDGKNAWPLRKEMLFRTIEAFGPDLLGLQEVTQAQADELRQRFVSYEMLGSGRNADKQGEASPILFRNERFEKLNSGMFWLSKTPDSPGSMGWDAKFPRVVTWVELRDRNAKPEQARLFFFNTHWDHIGKEARVQSARLMRERIDQRAGADVPVIVTGDFNCSDGSPPYVSFLDKAHRVQLIDSYRALRPQPAAEDFTFHGFTGKKDTPSRLDWILYAGDFTVAHCDIDRTNDDGRYPSDHFPVIAVLKRSGPSDVAR